MKPRVPLQVSPIFQQKLKQLKQKFNENGIDKSLRDLTEDLVNLNLFKEIENNIGNIKMDIRIRMDKRRRTL